MADPIVFPGTVEWSGENPGISLKDRPDGPFVALASFFRVVLSPHGRGHALVLLKSPESASPPRDRANYCLHDNEALARYLVAEFDRISVRAAASQVSRTGPPKAQSRRSIRRSKEHLHRDCQRRRPRCATDLERAGRPFCFAFPPEKSATGKHHMPSLFVGCQNATITVNGTTLRGRPVPREIAGRTITTAMLAFSETWIRAS